MSPQAVAPSSQPQLECVIGLEVHVQLSTTEKLFCANTTEFGAAPNTNVCPVCLGLPGALPVLNRQAVALAVQAALALDCTVHRTSVFARKNYFYPDLPKGYQISQFEDPLATDGTFRVRAGEPETAVRIRRIHMEEDAGKSLHGRIDGATAVDLNRAGTPLVEIVTEPDLRSPEDARAFLQRLKTLLQYLDVSDCNMEEGSLRVDANISIRPVGSTELGTKTELKNMNSFSGVEKALRVEIARQIERVTSGGQVEQETLLWDESHGRVRPMRSKEGSHDYRYFPDPDLPPLVLDVRVLEEAAQRLPELPDARHERLMNERGLSDYDAAVLTSQRQIADYFEALLGSGVAPKEAANWVTGPVLRAANERSEALDEFPVGPEALAQLIDRVVDGTLSRAMARKALTDMIVTGRSAIDVIEVGGYAQVSEDDAVVAWVREALAGTPEEVDRYRAGEARLLGFFMGEVMKRSAGRADPKRVREILARLLSEE